MASAAHDTAWVRARRPNGVTTNARAPAAVCGVNPADGCSLGVLDHPPIVRDLPSTRRLVSVRASVSGRRSQRVRGISYL